MFAATRKYARQDDDYVTRITAMQRGYFSGAAVAGLVDGRMLDWGRLLKDDIWTWLKADISDEPEPDITKKP